jgi:hypothetical protein
MQQQIYLSSAFSGELTADAKKVEKTFIKAKV